MKHITLISSVLIFLSGTCLSQTSTPRSFSDEEVQLLNTALTSEKNPATACLLSLVMPGLGEMSNDQVGLGVTLIVTSSVSGFFAINDDRSFRDFRIPALILFAGTHLFSLLNAPISASNFNEQRRNAIIELKRRGISLSSLSITPTTDFNSMVGLRLSINF